MGEGKGQYITYDGTMFWKEFGDDRQDGRHPETSF
ncbi:hypothetical protein EV130_103280 [Rhizobium azibense]|uniref:Uncharacterized protein n=1 Tax=Rhizobium azibense TaxID=1136135 RepID=A0A4V2VC92_9HYPH|nr:hypothetical protein EV130_103280 [Rhizobium azibense]